MLKTKLDCAYLIAKFPYHDQLKSDLLQSISKGNSSCVIDPGCDTNITSTDWNDATNFKREWVQRFINPFKEFGLSMYKELGYDGFTLHEIWFQQYQQSSGHGWHTHSSNFTNVYYLEMPDGAPKTKIVNPYNQTDVIEIDVEEGDMLIFPSFVIHKASANTIKEQKTIISYNINATYSNNIYGQGINE